MSIGFLGISLFLKKSITERCFLMQKIQILKSEEFGEIRTIEVDGETWFCGLDVARALWYKNTRDAIARHCNNVIKLDVTSDVENVSSRARKMQTMNFIKKPDLLRLIDNCKHNGAEQFGEWILEVVKKSEQSNKTLPYFKPSDYLSSANTTTSNTIVKSDTYINQIMKIPAYRGKNTPKTTVLVTYEGLENIQGLTPFNFTPFDRLVFDAVCTINQTAKRANKPTIFTPEMVARAMHGKSDKEYMPPLTVSTIAKSLDKMMTMFIIIDATAHVKSKNVEINEFKYKGYLLPMESLHINAGGTIVDSYELLKTPFLFQYASMVGQIINIDNELLNVRKLTTYGRITDKYLQMNIDKQILVRQLATRIDRIKRDKNHSEKKKKQNNIILFETLFKEAGIDKVGHPERLKTFVFSILDYYKALEHIKSYNKRTASGKKGYDGIEIII